MSGSLVSLYILRLLLKLSIASIEPHELDIIEWSLYLHEIIHRSIVNSIPNHALSTSEINGSMLLIRVHFANQFSPYYIPDKSFLEGMVN